MLLQENHLTSLGIFLIASTFLTNLSKVLMNTCYKMHWQIFFFLLVLDLCYIGLGIFLVHQSSFDQMMKFVSSQVFPICFILEGLKYEVIILLG